MISEQERLEEIKERLNIAASYSEAKGAYADMWWLISILAEKDAEIERLKEEIIKTLTLLNLLQWLAASHE